VIGGALTYGSYFEVNDNLKWKELGGNPKYCAFDCCVPGGVNELELYAMLMADSDCSFIGNGGNGWLFGTPKIVTPFLKEYRAIPAKQFKQSVKFSDPVAVWSLQEQNTFYFYTVNRLPYAIKVSVELDNAGEIVSAASNVKIGKSWLGFGNTISFELPAFMMKSFKTSGQQVAIKDVEVILPDNEIDKLKSMMGFAEKLLANLEKRRMAIELSKPDADNAIKLLSGALRAFEEKRYWQAKGNLSRVAMVRIYDMIGSYPPELHERKVSRDFTESDNAPKLVFSGEQDIMGDVRGRLSSVTSLCQDKQGNLFASSYEQLLKFSSENKYLTSYRLVLPHEADKGGTRHGRLSAPRYQRISRIDVLGGDRMAVLYHNLPLYIYSLKDSRLVPQINSDGYQMPGVLHRQLASDFQGNLYIGCSASKDKTGVWKFTSSGKPAYDFTTPEGQKTYRLSNIIPEGLVVDQTGKIYLGSKDKIHIYSESGKLLNTIGEIKLYRGIGALAISADGRNLFAASRANGDLLYYSLDQDGRFQMIAMDKGQGIGITSLLVDKSERELLIGYDKPINGAVAVKKAVSSSGLGKAIAIIKGLEAKSSCLNGYTQIKEFKGNLYFLSANKLMRIKPDANQVERVHDFGELRAIIESFAFTPNGDLFLASNSGLYKNCRGTNVYLAKRTGKGWGKPEKVNQDKPLCTSPYYVPSDMGVDAEGNLYVRHFEDKSDYHKLSIYKRSTKGVMKEFCTVGPLSHVYHDYGLHIDPRSGNVYIAGGATRTITCFSPNGKQLWKKEFLVYQGPGSVPIRDVAGITTDSHGNVWVTDPSSNRILCFDDKGKFLKKYGHFGTIDKRDGESLCYPIGIATAVDGEGQEWLYVADVNNQRIIKWRIEQ